MSWVDQKGPLGAAGFKEGDMIPEVNGGAITSVDAFIEAVAGLRPRQRATLLAVDHRTIGECGHNPNRGEVGHRSRVLLLRF